MRLITTFTLTGISLAIPAPYPKPQPNPEGEGGLLNEDRDLQTQIGLAEWYNRSLNDQSMVGVIADRDESIEWEYIKQTRDARLMNFENFLTSVPESSGHCPPTPWVSKFWDIAAKDGNLENQQVIGWTNSAFKHCKQECMGESPKWWEPFMDYGTGMQHSAPTKLITPKIILEKINERNCGCISCIRDTGKWIINRKTFVGRHARPDIPNFDGWINQYAGNPFFELRNIAQNDWNTCRCYGPGWVDPNPEPRNSNAESNPESNAESSPESNAESSPESHAESSPESSAESVPEAEPEAEHHQSSHLPGNYGSSQVSASAGGFTINIG